MREVIISIFCVFLTFLCVRSDSYMDAYKQSQNEKLDEVLVKGGKNIDREFIESNNIPYNYGAPPGPDSNNYGPPAPQYGPPNPAYNAPNPASSPLYGPPGPPPAYGPPAPQPAYGPPAPPPVYGPPAPPPPVYGPPAPPIYGPPSSSIQVFYGMPHALNSFWEKLKFKLDLFTIGKILLKLVLFKKFVSWVALICLLFFIPSLKSKFGAVTDGGGERKIKLKTKLGDEELNQLYNSIYKALDNFSYNSLKKQDKKQIFHLR